MKKERNANIELLRILSMMMVVMLHALGKGMLLPSVADMSNSAALGTVSYSINGIISWIFESLSISAVNIFMLISGYFLINSAFKVKRLVSLLLELVFYSLGAFLVCLVCGVNLGTDINLYFILQTVLPAHMTLYWFMSVYIIIYILNPLISAGVKALSQKQFGTILIILLIYECIFKSVLPVRLLGDNQGYDVLWGLIMFLIGAYFNLYGFKYINSFKKGVLLYFASSLLIFIETMAISFVTYKTGRLNEIAGISTDYNHIFVLLASVGLFGAFVNKKEMNKNFAHLVCLVSPMSLGVYLLHENLSLRYNWPKWFKIYDSLGDLTVTFVGKLVLAVLAIYVAGTIIDFVRLKIFKLIKL